MVEIKIKDLKSLEAIVTELQKNGYGSTCYIQWGSDGVENFTVQFDAVQVKPPITAEYYAVIRNRRKQHRRHKKCQQ